MESEKEFKEELKQTLPLYKIAGIIIGLLLLFGIVFAIITEKRGSHPATAPAPTEAPTVEPTPANISQNATQNVSANVTPVENVSNQTVQNVTNTTNATAAQLLNLSVPTPTPVNYSWNSITVTFPDTLKQVPNSKNSNQYITITEADGTPLANDEQFGLSVLIDDHYGKRTEIKPNFESNKWLVTLRIANTGNYTMTLVIDCGGNKAGHCKRFYGDGSLQKSADFEVI